MRTHHSTGPFQHGEHGQGPSRKADVSPSSFDSTYLLAKGIGKFPLSMTGATLLNPLYVMDGQISLEHTEFDGASTLSSAAPDGEGMSGAASLVDQLSAFGYVLVGVQYPTCAGAHKASGLPVVMVHARRNLLPVAQRLRKLLSSTVAVAILVDDNGGGDHTPGITRDDGPKPGCNDHAAEAWELEEDEWEQLERIWVKIERIAQRLEAFATGSAHHDHRREAKEQ